jgi:hypothetical protein
MPTYKLNIPTPCHEKWNEMSPTERGAFCQSCKKEVLDFSNKSYAEIADIVNAKKGASSICVKLSKQQTEFEYGYDAFIPQTSWLRRGMIGAALSILVAAFSSNAQTAPTKQKTESVAKKSTKKLVFTGKVMFEEGNIPAGGINVALANNWAYGAVTDSLGNFKLAIEKEFVADSLFTFTNIGCELLQVKLMPGVVQNIYLKKKVYELDPLVISADRYDKWHDHGYVGLLPIVNYAIYVRPAPDVPVDMKIRHYFGISYWD